MSQAASLAPITQMVRFVRRILQGTFDGETFDPEDIQGLAVECGLLVKTYYDPERHGTAGLEYCNPGDDWYELADWFKAAATWR